MLLRRVARPLFASWFLTQGLDALRHPAAHARRAREGVAAVADRVPAQARTGVGGPVADVLEGRLTDAQMATAVQAHGAAVVVAAAMLAVGRAPRTAALALAGLTLPLALVDLPVGGRRTLTPQARQERTERFVRAVAFTGGALLAGIDLEGRPGVSWRLQHARADRARLAQARADATA
ncbi:DoxX family membrane protein [Cellulomonas sp. SLBN-39]|uniref:DoxX family membrane protein n=1 Tax=Cellulomonas sp. SLBN-39 TaxID=2768446 RepID=UPI0011505E20|nr:DoxX family membrane protein [Cellulomonas sp. SLBN-39]TQL01149.1 DoxX-like protein [Cellulomonas sp. SLBN-39]